MRCAWRVSFGFIGCLEGLLSFLLQRMGTDEAVWSCAHAMVHDTGGP